MNFHFKIENEIIKLRFHPKYNNLTLFIYALY